MAIYEPIMDALLAYLQDQIPAKTFLTFRRGIVQWQELATQMNENPVIRQPALFLYDGLGFGGGSIIYSNPGGRATPTIRVIKASIVIYAKSSVAGGYPGGFTGGIATSNVITSQANMLHPLMEAVEKAIGTPDDVQSGTLTLGGLVAYCRIEGEGLRSVPDIDPNGQGMASLPIEMKVP